MPERAPSGTESVGTFRRYLSQAILGLGIRRFVFDGIVFFSKIKQTFRRDAKNATASRCLWNRRHLVGDAEIFPVGATGIPKISFDAPDDKVVAPVKNLSSGVRFNGISDCCT